jgi:glycosyltransferase involved in cell wall biosynthesis
MNLINKNHKAPKVSIFCMVYNHEPFIRECLEGFLMQKCNFDYEIVLGEDCSTDNSREIILEYASKFPEKFKLLLHEKNIGAAQNQKIVFENCTGKYIAMCEGDDYWTDPLKLQKQVDFLEKNEEYVCCIHNAVLLNSKLTLIPYKNYVNEKMHKYITMEELLMGNSFPTCSLLFKNILEYEKINELENYSVGDWILLLFLARKGNIYYDNTSMAVYRINESGEFSKLNMIEKFELNQLLRIQIYKYFCQNLVERNLVIKSKNESALGLIKQEIKNVNLTNILKLIKIFIKTNKLL